MKRCTKCGEEKPPESFVKDKRSSDGRTARCKTCVNADARERHAKRMESPDAKERMARTRATWAEQNRERVAASTRRWRKNHPERAKRMGREYQRKLKERDPDYWLRWYQANIEKERERAKAVMRRWRRENPEAEREVRRRYRANNLEAVRAREREKTYARRAMQPCSSELAALMENLVGQPCVYCGAKGPSTIDHIVPIARGGKHEADNLAPACLPCNCSKNDRLLSEWNGRLDVA